MSFVYETAYPLAEVPSFWKLFPALLAEADSACPYWTLSKNLSPHSGRYEYPVPVRILLRSTPRLAALHAEMVNLSEQALPGLRRQWDAMDSAQRETDIELMTLNLAYEAAQLKQREAEAECQRLDKARTARTQKLRWAAVDQIPQLRRFYSLLKDLQVS